MQASESHPQSPFREIIVATDFSEFADIALLRAANLALRYGAHITVAHIIDPELGSGSEGTPFVVHEELRTAEEKLEAGAVGLRECGIPHLLVARQGDIRDVLSSLVRERNADLLVLSTHGQYRFDRPVRSSIAEKILRIAPCPVMTVGPAAWLTRDAAYNSNHILFPTDLSPVSLRALPFVDALASLSGAEVTVLKVVPVGEHARADHAAVTRLQGIARQEISHTTTVHCMAQQGSLGETIAAVALARNCDFIVLGIHREDMSMPALGGLHLGLVYQIVSRTATPVFSVHDQLDIFDLHATRLAGISAHA